MNMTKLRAMYRLAIVVAVAGLLIGTALIFGVNNSVGSSDNLENTAEPATSQDYSKFTHTNPEHARLPCLLCHRREDNSAIPKRSSGHLPCSGCHTQEFNKPDSPMCTICHTSNQSKDVKPFPSLRSFNVKFSHATHIRGGAVPNGGCATCHKPANSGVAKSIPAGFSAHNLCYQCHAPKTKSGDKDISSCSTCHEIGRHSRTSIYARAYKVNFNHAKHTAKTPRCTDCHSVSGSQVSSPAATMHNNLGRAKNCSTCHNNQRTFGAENFANCKRCHTGTTFRF